MVHTSGMHRMVHASEVVKRRGGDTILRGYENLLIFDPSLGEEALEAEIDKLTNLIKDGGGAVVEVNRWGKTSLAYEIDKNRYGFYVLIEFFSEPALLSELDENLKLNPSVFRHSVGRTWVEPPAELMKKVAKKPKRKAPAKKKATPRKKSVKSKTKPKSQKTNAG